MDQGCETKSVAATQFGKNVMGIVARVSQRVVAMVLARM
jgi:hypothetical protein